MHRDRHRHRPRDGQRAVGTVKWSGTNGDQITGSPCALTQASADSASCSITYTPHTTAHSPHTLKAIYEALQPHATSHDQVPITILP